MRYPRPPRHHFPPIPPGESFAFVTNSGGTVSVINEGTLVSFPSFQYIGEGITINQANDRLTVEAPGNYFITYTVNLNALLNVSTKILVNGRPINASAIVNEVNRSIYSSQIILPLDAGDTISLQLFDFVGDVKLLQGAGATINLFRVH
ncbi:BclA C-terminal domain-containing protein [Bacillus sp. AL-1R]